MKCIHCGAALDPNSQFCSRCGKPAASAGLKATHREGDEQSVHTVRIDELLSGRYLLKARLGEGGMGTVYLAHDRELDREVAVKLLAASLVNDTEVVERFEREARMTAKLDHPNIVPVYDVGRHQGRPYMVMKNLEGTTLAALLREKGGLTADETLKLLRQLAAGIDFIHSKGFIHRDIKSGNIFVGSDGQATLLDFGILRQSHAGEGLTKTGVVMGTPHYMAPEQAIGAKNVDHRVDLYALAVVVFECLTGTLPFDADSELRLIQLQAHAPPPDLLERAPWIAKPVAEVVKRALAKRPEDRFSSAAEMLKALDAAYGAAKTQVVPQAAGAESPAAYKGPPVAPGTAPSWRRKSQGETSDPNVPVVKAMPTPVPSQPIVQTPFKGKVVVPPPNQGPHRRGVLSVTLTGVLLLGGVAMLAWRPWQGPPGVVETARDAGAPVLAAEVPDAGPKVAALAQVDAGAVLAVDPVPDAGRRGPLIAVLPRRGSVNVISTHDGEMFWGQVFLDGVEKGRTPLTLDLAPGRYQLRVERHGFRPQERQINVASGRSIVERFDLAP
ncbi:MAG: protein kinase [Archangiaceae bacterium]|nr:protein kinase [Archangiaceae bacterium]